MSDEFGVDVPMWDKCGELPPVETMRDRFAMAALTGMLAANDGVSADFAYSLADEMLEARKK